MVRGASLSVRRTLSELGVARSTFYRWYAAYAREGYDGLASRAGQRRRFWNRIPDVERERVAELAIEKPEASPRELAWHITDSEGWFEGSLPRAVRVSFVLADRDFPYEQVTRSRVFLIHVD